MKKFLPLILSLFLADSFCAQVPQDMAVELWANVQTSPPTVTLNWVASTAGTAHAVYRKLKTSTVWTPLVTLTGTATNYIDNTVTLGTNYEYRVTRTGTLIPYGGNGYINTGIEVPVVEARGKLILMVANTITTSLTNEIKRLKDDMEGDGWEVITLYVSPTASVPAVKNMIVSTYTLDPVNIKALFLLGHVPVPYSGDFGPDAHPDHHGAWPSDVYYGDMNGSWTDVSVNVTTGLPARTQNIPGDGKFDQDQPFGTVELQVGRVDLQGMTSFTATEIQLLKNYLDKDHDYRKKVFSTIRRAVIDDNFGYFSGEAFASSGYKNFGPLVGPANVTANDYFLTMANNASYLWSYGCGGGSFNSCGGIGVTSDFATSNLGGVFTMLFGSYFGDWDVNDNFLRAPLCQGKTLTNMWSGRPHLQLHHMGLGENIGYCARVAQNNVNTYYYSYAYNFAGTALMGDPTLRNDVVAPVSNVVATRIGNNANISWTASTQTNVLGYNIYMKNDTNASYVKINPSLISGTTYTDLCLVYPGIYKYMVRALVLETVPSGSYYNMSEGIADTAYNTNNFSIAANGGIQSQAGSVINFTASSVGGTTYSWNFGDATNSSSQNPAHTYAVSGNYTVTLVVSNTCNSKTLTIPVGITTGITKNIADETFMVFPNPSSGKVTINTSYTDNFDVAVYNTSGKLVLSRNTLSNGKELDLQELSKGLYLLQLKDRDNRTISKRIIIN
jgi:PKD repeat protein